MYFSAPWGETNKTQAAEMRGRSTANAFFIFNANATRHWRLPPFVRRALFRRLFTAAGRQTRRSVFLDGCKTHQRELIHQ